MYLGSEASSFSVYEGQILLFALLVGFWSYESKGFTSVFLLCLVHLLLVQPHKALPLAMLDHISLPVVDEFQG